MDSSYRLDEEAACIVASQPQILLWHVKNKNHVDSLVHCDAACRFFRHGTGAGGVFQVLPWAQDCVQHPYGEVPGQSGSPRVVGVLSACSSMLSVFRCRNRLCELPLQSKLVQHASSRMWRTRKCPLLGYLKAGDPTAMAVQKWANYFLVLTLSLSLGLCCSLSLSLSLSLCLCSFLLSFPDLAGNDFAVTRVSHEPS